MFLHSEVRKMLSNAIHPSVPQHLSACATEWGILTSDSINNTDDQCAVLTAIYPEKRYSKDAR
jgi:hypothetical protein